MGISLVVHSPSKVGCTGSIPGQGTKIPHELGPKISKHKTEVVLYEIQLKTFKKSDHIKKKERNLFFLMPGMYIKVVYIMILGSAQIFLI